MLGGLFPPTFSTFALFRSTDETKSWKWTERFNARACLAGVSMETAAVLTQIYDAEPDEQMKSASRLIPNVSDSRGSNDAFRDTPRLRTRPPHHSDIFMCSWLDLHSQVRIIVQTWEL